LQIQDPHAIFGEASAVSKGSPKAAIGPTDDFSHAGTGSPVVMMKAAFSIFPHGIKSPRFNKPRATKLM
jgi:hypothetical protein